MLKLEGYADGVKKQLIDEASSWSTRKQEEQWLRTVSPVQVVQQKINVLNDVMQTLNLLPQTSDVQAKKRLLMQHTVDLRYILTRKSDFYGLSSSGSWAFSSLVPHI